MKRETIYPKKLIRIMLHALGISNLNNGNYVQPFRRYSPYPTSHRNYYQISACEDWDAHVQKGYATFRKGEQSYRDYYFVTEKGKQYLRELGYKGHSKYND